MTVAQETETEIIVKDPETGVRKDAIRSLKIALNVADHENQVDEIVRDPESIQEEVGHMKGHAAEVTVHDHRSWHHHLRLIHRKLKCL